MVGTAHPTILSLLFSESRCSTNCRVPSEESPATGRDEIRRRLQRLVAGRSVDQATLSQLIQDMAELSYKDITQLRSEFEPNWFLPEWLDPRSSDELVPVTWVGGCLTGAIDRVFE